MMGWRVELFLLMHERRMAMGLDIKIPAEKFIALVLIVLFITGICAQNAGAEVNDAATEKSIKENSYTAYIEKHKDESRPADKVSIHAVRDLIQGEGCEVLNSFEGVDGPVLRTSEEGFAEWKCTVDKPGLYNIKIKYFPIEGKSSEIERGLQINGELPFREAEHLLFSRVWADSDEGIRKDNRGNDIRPEQVEKPKWVEKYFQDAMGYYSAPLSY